MRRANWGCYSGLLLLALLAWPFWAGAVSLQPGAAYVVRADRLTPPPADAGWQPVQLPAASNARAAWYRIDFSLDAVPASAWAVYLPYLYGGGRLFLNGEPLAQIEESSTRLIVRWERPHLVAMPPALLRLGPNQLALRVAATPLAEVRVPLLQIGPAFELQGAYEHRLFWIRTMAQFTVLSCMVVGTLALFIWWCRRDEVLYGLFGAAAWLWGLRTLTFVVETLPAPAWHAWRTLYHGATGGFVIVMLLFSMQLSGIRAGRLKWLLLAYWVLGPLGYAASGGNELLVGRFWTGGLLPIGAAVLVLSAAAAWRRASAPSLLLTLGLALGVMAGVHDYLLAAAPDVLRRIAPRAAADRVFLLHYAADILLIAMGMVLASRLVRTLEAIEQLNRTLEARAEEIGRRLAVNYERLLQLEREHAALRERQAIMRDLHDGLGSRLFLTLSRAEADRVGRAEIVDGLRQCIADMRVTLDAMSPDGNDFLQAWSSFRFRWQQLLEDAGLGSRWEVETGSEPLLLPQLVTVQVLRIVQEALTNAIKHAGATTVAVRVRADATRVQLEVSDDGAGLASPAKPASHGIANMRARAARLGAQLEIADGAPGVRVLLSLQRAPACVTPALA